MTTELKIKPRQSNIEGVVEEICKWNLSPDCLYWGDKTVFKGRCCPYCSSVKSRRWYVDNKETKKQQTRDRARRLGEIKKQAKLDALAQMKLDHPKIQLVMKKLN